MISVVFVYPQPISVILGVHPSENQMASIKLGQLEILLATVEAGSFSAAAIDLGCTQSRVSHAIAELESIVGTTLLIRSRSGCTPTQAGHEVAAKARQVFKLTRSIEEVVLHGRHLTGHVRIACFRSVGTHLLPVVVAALAGAHPGIKVDILDGCNDYSDVISSVENGVADIGITRGPVAPHLYARSLGHDVYVAAVPDGERWTSPVQWDDLARLPFIHVAYQGGQWILEKCRSSGFNQAVARVLFNESAILAMVAAGLGFTLLPHLSVFPVVKGVRLLQLPLDAIRTIHLVTLRDAPRESAVRVVINFLRDKKVFMQTEAWQLGAFFMDNL